MYPTVRHKFTPEGAAWFLRKANIGYNKALVFVNAEGMVNVIANALFNHPFKTDVYIIEPDEKICERLLANPVLKLTEDKIFNLPIAEWHEIAEQSDEPVEFDCIIINGLYPTLPYETIIMAEHMAKNASMHLILPQPYVGTVEHTRTDEVWENVNELEDFIDDFRSSYAEREVSEHYTSNLKEMQGYVEVWDIFRYPAVD